MASVEDLLNKYIFDIENQSRVNDQQSDGPSDETPEWLSSVTCEEYWKKLIDLSFDRELTKEYFNSINDRHERELFFQFGVACLIRFIQCNFTGPELPSQIADFFDKEMFKQTDFAKLLSIKNDDVNINTKYPALFAAADLIIDYCIISILVNTWWKWRLVFIHQRLFDDLCPSLHQTANNLYKEVETCPLEGNIKALFDIEMAQLFLLFRNVSRAKEHIISASKILGLEYQLVGKIGKRTRFQERALAQLAVEATLEEREGIDRSEVADYDVPANISLRDDERFDTPEFLEAVESIVFPKTEQKLFIAIINDMMISKPLDELHTEEVQPFIDFILNQKNPWAVRTAALLLRCKLEEKARRSIERCFTQCEEIISSFRRESPGFLHRVTDVFGCGLGPMWSVQEQYARLLFNVGLIKNSLDIYLDIKAWDDVIVCYNLLQLRHKAVEIIKQQLEEKPSVKLWCLLGDSSDDVTCYEKAWLMSKKRSHRAQRHWGNYYFDRKNYEECIPHYERSLSINPLQEKVWFRLGYAAQQVENWQVAATAYRRHTTLEPEGFEAWNNLAQAYIKLGNKRSAHQAILEALKCNYEHWRVWENLLFVSCDISHFSDMIRAYHRVLDLQGKYLNIGVLNILVYGVCNDLNDAEGNPSGRLVPNTRELLGRVTSIHPSEGAIWELYAAVAQNNQLRAQRLQRAYRGYTQTVGWDKDPNSCQLVLLICKKLGQIALEQEIEAKDPMVNSIKLNLSSALAVAKKQAWNELDYLVKDVSTLVEKIKEKLKKRDENK